MHDDDQHSPRASARQGPSRSRTESDDGSTRNVPDDVNFLHRLATSGSGSGRSNGNAFVDSAETAFDCLAEGQRLLLDDEPVDWRDIEGLNRRTQHLRSRIVYVNELEQAVLDYRDALYDAGVMRRRMARRQGRLYREVEIEKLRIDGTLYREEKRTQNRPAHIDVDPNAWNTVKRDALKRYETIGGRVGELVVQFTGKAVPPPHSSVRTSEHRFARLTVPDESWASFRGLAVDAHVTTARLVGLVVETEAVCLGWRSTGDAR